MYKEHGRCSQNELSPKFLAWVVTSFKAVGKQGACSGQTNEGRHSRVTEEGIHGRGGEEKE